MITHDNEVWRDIAGFEGRYQISDRGRVFSVRSQRCLALNKCTNGYSRIDLGRDHHALVHRLVAKAFVPGWHEGLEVNHKNGNRADNRAENLEWVTRGENHAHSYRELNRKKHALTRLVCLRDAAGALLQFASGLEAARHLGVSPGSVSSAVLRGHRCRGYEVSYV